AEAPVLWLPDPKNRVYFCPLLCGGLESSSLISGIPDSFSYDHHWKFVLSFKRNSASLGAAELLYFIFLGSKITADSDCSHEIKRRLLL
uniref:Uncharacterized protein n=1 Tax=Moschus moschiferus TaxID=68415 RepID=A0A8C6CG03_MOSMO